MTKFNKDAEMRAENWRRFIDKAGVAAAVLSTVTSFEEAAAYAVKLCLDRPRTRYAIDDRPADGDGVDRVIAAPLLAAAEFALLRETCAAQGITCIDEGLRAHLAGVDVGFCYGDIGLAETGTVVLNCPDEELRLATMVCEYHVCILPRSRIVADGYAAEEQLRRLMLDAPTYTAFITGPSRTADIERVLSIGVHGPLELHILIMED